MTSADHPDSDRRSRQKRVGDALRDDTRRRILDAASTEFAAHGYAATTVTRLATAAGVSVQTLYSAWGSKRELLRGYFEHALAGGASSPEDVAARFTGLPAADSIALLAQVVSETARRAAVGWSLYRDAAATDPDIAADWDDLQHLRRRLFARVLEGIPTEALREGITRETAVDTAWAIASPESYELLCGRLGYDIDRFRAWMADTLAAALLARP